MTGNLSTEYPYETSSPSCAHPHLWPAIRRILAGNDLPDNKAFDLGCGNGATANYLTELGFDVAGVDPSTSGIQIANQAYPQLKLYNGSAYDDLAEHYGIYSLVISLEVIEHVYWPRKFAKTFFDLVNPSGVGIISTPYHGYWKNLALALAGKWDNHLKPLRDGGHIKFFSERSLHDLLSEAGFRQIEFMRAGRIPPVAKSMIAIVRK